MKTQSHTHTLNLADKAGFSSGCAELHLVDPTEAASFLCIPVKTLACWRSQGRGPAYRKLGRRIVYTLSDLQAWVEAHPTRAGK